MHRSIPIARSLREQPAPPQPATGSPTASARPQARWPTLFPPPLPTPATNRNENFTVNECTQTRDWLFRGNRPQILPFSSTSMSMLSIQYHLCRAISPHLTEHSTAHCLSSLSPRFCAKALHPGPSPTVLTRSREQTSNNTKPPTAFIPLQLEGDPMNVNQRRRS